MGTPRTILHVITGIDVGGAEFMLARTIEHGNPDRYRHGVVCLRGRGELAAKIEQAGAAFLVCLDIRGPWSALTGFLRLCTLVRRSEVGAIQTWLAHGTLFGSLAALLTGRRELLWCIHTGNQDPARIARPIRIINRLLALLSRVAPRQIVSVSQAASEHCARLGFPRDRIQLIPNGTDTEAFRPDPSAGAELRDALGIPQGAPVLGIIGRYTPEKDFATFFRAALLLQEALPDAHFLLCGKGLTAAMPEAASSLPLSRSPGHFHFAGARQDMRRVYNACDIAVLTSASEAFPLVLGEAMACGIPVAATDVGDCRALTGEAGRIAPAGDAPAIAAAWLELLTLPPAEYRRLGDLARERICTRYGIRSCIERYERIYDELSAASADLARLSRTPQPATTDLLP